MKSNDEAEKVPLADVVSSETGPSELRVPKPGELVPQKHGGALRHGSAPGGPGRTTNAFRNAMQVAAMDALPVIVAIVAGEVQGKVWKDGKKGKEIAISCSPSERVRAWEALCRYGGVDKLPLLLENPADAKDYSREDYERMWRQIERMRDIKQLEKMFTEHAKKGE